MHYQITVSINLKTVLRPFTVVTINIASNLIHCYLHQYYKFKTAFKATAIALLRNSISSCLKSKGERAYLWPAIFKARKKMTFLFNNKIWRNLINEQIVLFICNTNATHLNDQDNLSFSLYLSYFQLREGRDE